jgi:mannose-1-phosphate guanylyltransferase / mannose-6-phosphate isomerase
MSLYPVILAGGAGSRLWPMSRESRPKQFLPLLDGRSPFEATLDRLEALRAQPATVVTGADYRFLVADQLKRIARTPRALYLEPFGRSTAPAIAVVAFDLVREDPEALMLVLPADHDVPESDLFAEAVRTGEAAAASGHLVVFGIEPRWAETGYGYIERGEPLAQAPGCHAVSAFVEKPEYEIAARLAQSGRHYWNAGMFLFHVKTFIDELERLEPELAAACAAAAAAAIVEDECRRITPQAFERCAAMSVDHAVLERTNLAAVVPARFRWSDIGSWDALQERGAADGDGNECHGDVQLHDAQNCYIRSEDRLVVGIDLDGLVIVDTPDALLIARRGQTQRVREAVDRLKSAGRDEYRTHRLVHRPWGCYEDIDAGERFRVKRITVDPGGKLSLQYHHHRAEHWIVVSGTARVTRGDEVRLLTENQSIYIELGQLHRLENPGKVPLRLIEVQTGSYLGEDDIVRVEDVYRRAPEAHDLSIQGG